MLQHSQDEKDEAEEKAGVYSFLDQNEEVEIKIEPV